MGLREGAGKMEGWKKDSRREVVMVDIDELVFSLDAKYENITFQMSRFMV